MRSWRRFLPHNTAWEFLKSSGEVLSRSSSSPQAHAVEVPQAHRGKSSACAAADCFRTERRQRSVLSGSMPRSLAASSRLLELASATCVTCVTSTSGTVGQPVFVLPTVGTVVVLNS